MWTIRRVEVTGSTNADVAAAARSGADEGLAILADHQVAGRGRLDRSWHTPAGVALTVSFLVRPDDVPVAQWTWLPLLAGVAVVDAVRELAPSVPAQVKWPNDVLVGGAKLAGILVERVDTPTGPAAVVGIGLNVAQVPETGLVDGAASLRSLGVDVGRDLALAALGRHLADRYTAWHAAQGDPDAGLADDYRARSATLGRRVRVQLPGDTDLVGVARDVDGRGRLVIVTDDAATVVVGAGDVVHLRPAQPS